MKLYSNTSRYYCSFVFLQKQSLSKRSRGLCATCVTAPSLPESPNKLAKGLTNIFPVRKMACQRSVLLSWAHASYLGTALWMERRSLLHYTRGEKGGERVLECWAQHHCPNEKVQVIKIHSYQRSQSRRKWADCSACQKTAAEEDSVCPLILTYSIKGKHSEPVEETLQTSEGLEWRKLWVENL